MATRSIVAVLAILPLVPLLLIFLTRLCLRALGWLLQAQTKERRSAIISQVETEKAALLHDQPSQETEDGWERIDKSGTAENSKPLTDVWNGVVGFFHPFW